MKIVNIVPGFGGTFYCGNCLRDSAFVGSLREAGHDAVIVPVYLPLNANGNHDREDIPVFYGAVNIYLKQQFPIFRKMPDWMERFFNSSMFLKLAAKKAGSTRAHGLEDLTESMLLGNEGNQRGELLELVSFLKDHLKPDVVHFSNALLLGMAKQIKEELKIPVVCSLQDEDVWVDALHGDHRDYVWQLLSEKGRDVDAFIAVSGFYAGLMKEKLAIPAGKINVVHIGINPDHYHYSPPVTYPRSIGFLSRLYEENGLAIIVDAFIILKSGGRFNDLRLHLSGGMTGDDRDFFNRQMRKLRKTGLSGDVRIFHNFSNSALRKFFESLTALSVPVLKGEAFGLYQLEAMASGIPLVQPALGAFPEVIGATGGGIVYHPNTAETLASTLAGLLPDHEKLNNMSQSGYEMVREKFNCGKLTRKIIEIYQKIQ